jgi:DNA-binding beta-propeller fold protein YncE
MRRNKERSVPTDAIGDIAADPTGSTLVVTHPGVSAVSILDADNQCAASLIPLRDVALSPDGATAYLLAHHPRGAAAVIRIDAAGAAIGAVVEVGESATQLAVSPDGARVYVVESCGVAVICALTGAVLDRITVGEWPSCLAAGLATGRLYVADYAGVLIGVPAATPVPATPPLREALPALGGYPVLQLQSAAV